jgi:hypothetical protein
MARRAGNAEQIAVEDSLQEVTTLKLIFYSWRRQVSATY